MDKRDDREITSRPAISAWHQWRIVLTRKHVGKSDTCTVNGFLNTQYNSQIVTIWILFIQGHYSSCRLSLSVNANSKTSECNKLRICLNNVNNQLDATITVLLLIPISSTCFEPLFAHLQERQTVCYSLWYNAPTMFMAGSMDAEALTMPPLPCYRPSTMWVHYTSCNTESTAPEDGRIVARNRLSWLESVIKLLLLHLVGYPHYLYLWCTAKQISNLHICQMWCMSARRRKSISGVFANYGEHKLNINCNTPS